MQKRFILYVCMAVITLVSLRFYISVLRPFVLFTLAGNEVGIQNPLYIVGLFILGGAFGVGGIAILKNNQALLLTWTFKAAVVLISGGFLSAIGGALCSSALIYLFFDIL